MIPSDMRDSGDGEPGGEVNPPNERRSQESRTIEVTSSKVGAFGRLVRNGTQGSIQFDWPATRIFFAVQGCAAKVWD